MHRNLVTALALYLVVGTAPSAIAQDKVEIVTITPALVAAAEREGSVVMAYSSPLVTQQAIIDEFHKRYPKVDVKLERRAGAKGAYTLLQEFTAGVRRIDVFEGSDNAADAELQGKGVFVAARPANFNDRFPAYRPSKPYLYSPNSIRNVVAYNTKFVTDAEAQKLSSWKGILDPVFKNRFSIVEPTFGSTIAPVLYVMSQPDLGVPFLRALALQQPTIYVNTAQARDALISGQKPISWGTQWEAVMLEEYDRGSPVRFVYPNPTVEWSALNQGIVSNAPHPNAARLLWAWFLSEDGARAVQMPPSNSRSTLSTVADNRPGMLKVAKEPWYKPPPVLWQPDTDDWIKNGAAYQEQWRQIFQAAK